MQALKNEKEYSNTNYNKYPTTFSLPKEQRQICIEPQTNTKTEIQPEDHNPYNRISKHE